MAAGGIAVQRVEPWVAAGAAAQASTRWTALTAMLFRPPDLHFYDLDRIALALLLAVVSLRALALRLPFSFAVPVALPLFILMVLNLFELLSRPSQTQDWSTFAAKWAVPFLLYHIAQLVFVTKRSLQQLETFLLIVLSYLSVIAFLFLIGAKAYIFPSFILDEGLGIHVDRARGPFLQAVANGVSLTLLGLIALDSYRRHRLRGFLAFAFVFAVPAAVLATKTRSVWISFAGATVALWVFSSDARIRRACRFLTLAAIIVASGTCWTCLRDGSLGDRLEERSPVEFRLSMYRAGWEMLQQKPIFGWHADDIQPELAKIVDGFHQEQFFFHNSYLEVAVTQGIAGLFLYSWLLVDLFRVGRQTHPEKNAFSHFVDQKFRSLWPMLVAVYLANASFVVMNYQFVNGLVFTLAGILAAQNKQTKTIPAF